MAMFEKRNTKSCNEVLEEISARNNFEITSKEFQEYLDENDPISHLRDEYIIPHTIGTAERTPSDKCIYFSGNGLGLQPKCLAGEISKILDTWGTTGNDCRTRGHLPATCCDDYVTEGMARLVGAHVDEVAAMNGLTVNPHLMLVSFYRPTAKRHKILLESKAFTSDHYTVESQIRMRGYDPRDSMIMVARRQENGIWEMDDVIAMIEEHGHEIALVKLPGLHFLTGQVFDMKRITQVAHSKGCMVGFDLAHAVGNIELHVHDWDVDFAVWCTYKYLNAGSGSVGGAFMHREHANNDFPKLTGWIGHKLETRFDMTNELDLIPGIQGYRLTSAPHLLIAALQHASLAVFEKTNMKELIAKSFLLTGYLEYLLRHYFSKSDDRKAYIEIITPRVERGCQLSLIFHQTAVKVQEELIKHNVSCEVRHPVVRVTPAPMYNTFHDVFQFVQILRKVLLQEEMC